MRLFLCLMALSACATEAISPAIGLVPPMEAVRATAEPLIRQSLPESQHVDFQWSSTPLLGSYQPDARTFYVWVISVRVTTEHQSYVKEVYVRQLSIAAIGDQYGKPDWLATPIRISGGQSHSTQGQHQ